MALVCVCVVVVMVMVVVVVVVVVAASRRVAGWLGDDREKERRQGARERARS